MSKETINEPEHRIQLNYIRRYPVEGIFADNTGFSKQPTIVQHVDPYRKHESITDKESYRLSLASARGAMSSLSEGQQKGLYLFPDGKYDKSKDISYILRKDLSVTEIDEYISRLKENREIADEKLTNYLDNKINELEAKKVEVINTPKIDDSKE